MRSILPLAALALAAPLAAQDEPPQTPAGIVNAAPQEDWVVIPPEDLLVMELAPDAEGNPRRVTIQLIPPPFSQGWVRNIRKLAALHWWDGTNIYRVQDNYVVQWGGGAVEKQEPEGLNVVPESEYVVRTDSSYAEALAAALQDEAEAVYDARVAWRDGNGTLPRTGNYADLESFYLGWPFAADEEAPAAWPVHCYGMVGVARGLDNTGSGSDLYVVIGHAPRQLDRNIALVGRVIGGVEFLSSLPRGKGELGFYDDDEADKRVPILSVRLASELSQEDQPNYEYLSTESESFAAYVHARANRQDDFYHVPAGGVDICNAPVPVRPFEYNE